MNLRRRWRELPDEVKVTAVIAPIVLLLLSNFLIPRLSDALSDKGTSKLEVVDLVVRNGVYVDYVQRAEVTLHNTGNRRSIIKRAIFTIRGFSVLPNCYPQEGDVPISQQYSVVLPVHPEAGKVLEEPISQQLGADEADRFAFRFTVPEREASLGNYLFQMEISLVHDSERTPLKVGQVMLSLPNVPPAEELWDKKKAADPAKVTSHLNHLNHVTSRDIDPNKVIECWKSNTRKLRSMASLNSEHSAELDEVIAELA